MKRKVIELPQYPAYVYSPRQMAQVNQIMARDNVDVSEAIRRLNQKPELTEFPDRDPNQHWPKLRTEQIESRRRGGYAKRGKHKQAGNVQVWCVALLAAMFFILVAVDYLRANTVAAPPAEKIKLVSELPYGSGYVYEVTVDGDQYLVNSRGGIVRK